jgi:hypothetical protein
MIFIHNIMIMSYAAFVGIVTIMSHIIIVDNIKIISNTITVDIIMIIICIIFTDIIMVTSHTSMLFMDTITILSCNIRGYHYTRVMRHLWISLH